LRVILIIALCALGISGCSRPESAARPLSAQEVRGERLYRTACAGCHRANSTDPLNGPGLRGIYKKPYLPSGAPANDERVRDVIRHGRRMMPGFGQVYDDQQLTDLIAYLRTL
jgi:mono/diheme cytochrome c family protein